jgi:hypothetical protein
VSSIPLDRVVQLVGDRAWLIVCLVLAPLQFRASKRKEYEDQIRRQRQLVHLYMKYASWEESQNEFERARSIFER